MAGHGSKWLAWLKIPGNRCKSLEVSEFDWNGCKLLDMAEHDSQNSITLNNSSSKSTSATTLLERLRKKYLNFRHSLQIFLDILEPKVKNKMKV